MLPPEPITTGYRELVDFSEVQNYGNQTSAQTKMLHDLEWFGDGVDIHEKPAADVLVSLAVFGPDVFSNLIDRPWVQDGLNQKEEGVLWSMTWLFLDRMGEEFTRLISKMPFLETFEPWDSFAFTALTELMLRGEDDRHFQEIWGHPAVGDGIDDHDAETLAKLLVVGWDEYDPESVESLELLDPQQFEVERRTIILPLAGEVEIHLQRRSGTEWVGTMDHIETALRLLEKFMSAPLPYQKVDFVVSENIQKLSTQSGGGVVLMGDGYSEQLIERNDWVESSYVHEMAHFYWDSGPWWIKEGAATFLEDVWGTAQDGTPLLPDYAVYGRCGAVRNLKQFDEGVTDLELSACAYGMGALLFHDLHHSMGELSFRSGFRRLYLLSRHPDSRDECSGIRLTVCHVRAAFTEEMPEDASRAAREVIDKWYEGEYPRLHADSVTFRGKVLSRDGEPLDGIGLSLWSGHKSWYAATGVDGSFYVIVKQGAFKLLVHPPRGCIFESWYGGEGRLVSSRDEAVELMLDGSVSESIDIRLPVSSDDLHCGTIAIRGTFILADSERSETGRESRGFAQINVYAGSPGLGDVDSDSVSDSYDNFELFVPDRLAVQLRLQGITRDGEWLELGWLGENGLTKDFSEAVTFNLDGEDIEGVEIRLQALP